MGRGTKDLQALVKDVLLRETDAESVEILSFERLGGGAIQENYAVDASFHGGPWAGIHELVLRKDAPSGLPISLTRAQEFAVLQAAFAAGVSVPEPLWLHQGDAEAGQDFYLMRRISGSAAPRSLVRGNLSREQRESLLQQLGESLGRLHRIRPPHPGLEFLRVPEQSPVLARISDYRRYLDELGRPHPTLEWALRWLEMNAPEDNELVLTHGDFRTGNFMVDDGRLTGILDWELAAWNTPMEDIGWFCARCWRFGVWEHEAGGIGAPEALMRGYRRTNENHLDMAQLPYWRVMGTMRWAIIALLQAERHLSGRESSLELALTGRMLPEIELDLIQEIALIEQEQTSHA